MKGHACLRIHMAQFISSAVSTYVEVLDVNLGVLGKGEVLQQVSIDGLY